MIGVYIAIALIVGAVFSWLVAKNRFGSEISRVEERAGMLSSQNEKLDKELKEERQETESLRQNLIRTEAENKTLSERLKEQREDLENVRKQMQSEFENLAQKIFDEKSQKFTKQNKENLDTLLKPLNEKIKEFETKVEKSNRDSLEQHSKLSEQLRNLKELNQDMAEEARNLTKALKGDTKTQGNWGEQILEKLLEYSGLVKGRDYETQKSFTDQESGSRARPDVIVHLPEDKDIIIDSKVSLVAYERYVNAETDEERALYAKEHLKSIQEHIKGLSGKNYQAHPDIKSLDYVILFIPIEPAFMLAVQQDDQLYTKSLEKNIAIVSPSTLLITLRTVASIWKQEFQNRNAQQIAQEAGKLYDKFVGFMEDLDKIGKKIDETHRAYDAAKNKLIEGNGNLVRRVEKLREMGASNTKALDSGLVEDAQEEN